LNWLQMMVWSRKTFQFTSECGISRNGNCQRRSNWW
jgi:hypothetical protein